MTTFELSLDELETLVFLLTERLGVLEQPVYFEKFEHDLTKMNTRRLYKRIVTARNKALQGLES